MPPSVQQTFTWQQEVKDRPGYGLDFFYFNQTYPIHISRTQEITLSVDAYGRTCYVLGTYNDFTAHLLNTPLGAGAVLGNNRDHFYGFDTKTIPAGDYELDVFLEAVRGGTDGCLLSVSMKYY